MFATPRLLLFCCLVVALNFAITVHAQQDVSPWLPDRILVRYRASLSPDAKQLLHAKYRVRALKSFANLNLESLQIPHTKEPLSVVAALRRDPAVVYAQPVFRYHLAETLPDDPLFSSYQWSLRNTGQTIAGTEGVPGADVHAAEFWDTQTGTTETVVAIIDTGAHLSHTDLAANIWINQSEIPDNSIDDDENGYVDDWHGWNFVRNDNDPSDVLGHGTHVSGIVGAVGNNLIGISGVCWRVRLMELACFDSSGEATDESLIPAILYAAENGARVCNASWGDFVYSPAMRDAIDYAASRGVLFVAAAGNASRQNNDQMPFYPASFDLPSVISVAATDNRDHLASFSNIGYNSVHVAAPGRSIYSLVPGAYNFLSGTSMASPHVAGAAALLLSQYPTFTVGETRSRIIGSSDRKPWLERATLSNGRLNLPKMLEDDAIAPSAINDLSILAPGFDRILLTFTAPGDDASTGTATYYDVRYSTAPITLANWQEARKSLSAPSPFPAGSRQLLTVAGLDDAIIYYVAVRAVDNVGNVAPLSDIANARTCPVEQLFFDDFETSSSIWNSSAGWQRSTVDSHSGSFCFTDSPYGTYPNANADYILTCSAPINLAARHNAYLSFYQQYNFFAPNYSVNDLGFVEVSTDGGVTWKILKTYYSGAMPWRRDTLSLAPFDGADALLFRFRLHTDADGFVNDGWYIDDVRVFVPQCSVAVTDDIIIETYDRFYQLTAPPTYSDAAPDDDSWATGGHKSDLPYLVGRNARYNRTDEITTASATFVPLILTPGRYEVFVTWGADANAANVRFTVRHLDGATDVFLTQHPTANSDRWISLGTYSFAYGQDAARCSVTIDESTVTGKPEPALEGRVYADSVKFVFIEPTTVSRPNQSWLLR